MIDYQTMWVEQCFSRKKGPLKGNLLDESQGGGSADEFKDYNQIAGDDVPAEGGPSQHEVRGSGVVDAQPAKRERVKKLTECRGMGKGGKDWMRTRRFPERKGKGKRRITKEEGG